MRRVLANVRILTLAAAVLVIGAVTGSVWAARTLTAEDPPEWVTDQQALKEAVEHDNALIAQDQVKPRARGEFGPFLLVGPGEPNESESPERCDVETSYNIGRGGLSLGDVLASPLAIPELSNDNVSLMAGACDGVVISVNGGWTVRNDWGGEEAVDVGILLIGHLPFRTEWDTAGDRTELGKIDGYPAMIERPIPGLIMDPPSEALILFAEPKGDGPGIVLSVGAPSASLERAAHSAISSLAKRIAEMGLPPKPAGTFTAEVPPKWMTDQLALMETIKHDNALIEQDQLKPRARGEFGPFLAVAPEDINEPASRERCDVRNSYGVGVEWESLPLADALSSPLAIPELSADSLTAGSCDGVITMVDGSWLMPNDYGGDEPVDVTIMLVAKLPKRVDWPAAADRTELGKSDGYPALIEQPIPGQIMNTAYREADILFAEPKDGAPAIVVRVTAASLERAAHSAISSLEKRIAEMGLPPNPYN